MSTGLDGAILGPWLASVRQSGPAVHLLAFACLACSGAAGWLRHRSLALGDVAAARRWTLLLVVWGTLTAAFAWRLDVLLSGALRQLVVNSDWYLQRRVLQGAVLSFACGLIALLLWRGLSAAPAGRGVPASERVFLVCSLCMLALLAVRVSSLHAFDALLAVRLPGASAGRWLEAALVVAALVSVVRAFPRH